MNSLVPFRAGTAVGFVRAIGLATIPVLALLLGQLLIQP